MDEKSEIAQFEGEHFEGFKTAVGLLDSVASKKTQNRNWNRFRKLVCGAAGRTGYG
jgi:hypothetical protein